ncbi:hypothetical protein [Nonomuraea guangzhouensis]|uniref:Uncharacterized protein n=1 Tax=Nonomuraea guangzhouensis TaxID=1291555 RepID=A0ABW4FYK0_9ACTN|nr:hypothetical protein [Nonomuraea guangzhouensis]
MNDHVIRIPDSHLRPGLILDTPADPADFLLIFADGSESRVQLVHDDTGRPVLRVGGYVTTRGDVVQERVWTVREMAPRDGHLRLRLGHSISPSHPGGLS